MWIIPNTQTYNESPKETPAFTVKLAFITLNYSELSVMLPRWCSWRWSCYHTVSLNQMHRNQTLKIKRTEFFNYWIFRVKSLKASMLKFPSVFQHFWRVQVLLDFYIHHKILSGIKNIRTWVERIRRYYLISWYYLLAIQGREPLHIRGGQTTL